MDMVPDMVAGELFPTLHWMTWRMDAWLHGCMSTCNHAIMQPCSHAIIYSIIPSFPL
jgi:hypothetical protein